MKIGVVTYWYGNSNYGMILQCWALQQFLKKMGNEPFVIRYEPVRPWYIQTAKFCIKFIKSVFLSRKREELKRYAYNTRRDTEREFAKFRTNNLNMSSRQYEHIGQLRNAPPNADCYIAGSDQIWCYDLNIDKDARGFFLDFGNTNVRRIAYAPSFGRMVYSSNNSRPLIEVLSKFDYLSCRELNGVEMCRQLGFDAQHVVDPTLLLSSDDYNFLCEDIGYDKYFFIYSVNLNCAEDIYWNQLKEMFPKVKFVVTPASGSINGGELFGNDVTYEYATPGKWLSLIRDADIIITSSFHGVVFSIIYNKRFAFVPLKGEFEKTNNRVFDLLNALNLRDLVVDSPCDYSRILSHNINWNEVNGVKERLIKSSVQFLENSLKSV